MKIEKLREKIKVLVEKHSKKTDENKSVKIFLKIQKLQKVVLTQEYKKTRKVFSKGKEIKFRPIAFG